MPDIKQNIVVPLDDKRDVTLYLWLSYQLASITNCGISCFAMLSGRIDYLKGQKYPTDLFTTSAYGTTICSSAETERKLFRTALKQAMEIAAKALEQAASGTGMILLTDSVNREARSSLTIGCSFFYGNLLMEWVKANGYGVVTQSHAAVNPVHSMAPSPSVVRGWFWSPPLQRDKYGFYDDEPTEYLFKDLASAKERANKLGASTDQRAEVLESLMKRPAGLFVDKSP